MFWIDVSENNVVLLFLKLFYSLILSQFFHVCLSLLSRVPIQSTSFFNSCCRNTVMLFVAAQQTFVGLEDVLKASSRHVLKTSSKSLQRNNFSSSKTFSRRLARGLLDVFKTSSKHLCKMSSRRLGRRKIVTLKTCWRRLQDMSWRRLQDVFKTNKCLLGNH